MARPAASSLRERAPAPVSILLVARADTGALFAKKRRRATLRDAPPPCSRASPSQQRRRRLRLWRDDACDYGATMRPGAPLAPAAV
jgi:hypothetical protein